MLGRSLYHVLLLRTRTSTTYGSSHQRSRDIDCAILKSLSQWTSALGRLAPRRCEDFPARSTRHAAGIPAGKALQPARNFPCPPRESFTTRRQGDGSNVFSAASFWWSGTGCSLHASGLDSRLCGWWGSLSSGPSSHVSLQAGREESVRWGPGWDVLSKTCNCKLRVTILVPSSEGPSMSSGGPLDLQHLQTVHSNPRDPTSISSH